MEFSEATPVLEEIRQACSSPDLQALFAKKMACKAIDTTPQQLSDRSKVSSDEKAALLRWRALVDEDNKKLADINRQYNPKSGDAMASVIESGTTRLDALASELNTGRITWDEFNKRRIENVKKYEEDLKMTLAMN